MNRTRLFVQMALLLSFVIQGCCKDPQGQSGNEEERIVGLFSVSDTKQVEFSSGNLAVGGRGFLINQYDCGGYFGWGTGNNPDNSSEDYNDYAIFYDWGDYMTGGWRTLSKDEWEYLLSERADADIKLATGSVVGVPGLILLPDDWILPTGCLFNPKCKGWDNNRYSHDQWKMMENAGAVFLTAAGYYRNSSYYSVGMNGFYWTSSYSDDNNLYAYCLYFDNTHVYMSDSPYRFFGQSVRLVRDKK